MILTRTQIQTVSLTRQIQTTQILIAQHPAPIGNLINSINQFSGINISYCFISEVNFMTKTFEFGHTLILVIITKKLKQLVEI